MLNYQYSLRGSLTVWFQDLTMVSLKFAAVFCLVYFTIFVNAGGKRACKKVLEKLDNIESLCQGRSRNVFFFVDVLNCLKLSFSVIVNI